MKIGPIFEEVTDELTMLYHEGKKFFPKLKLKVVGTKVQEEPTPRFFLNYPKNKGSYSVYGFKSLLVHEKINKLLDWLNSKFLIKDVNRSRTTNSVYFTLNGKYIRLSDHKKNSFVGKDILINWNTSGEEIKNLILSI